MGRPTRKKLEVNEESFNELLQECYEDTHRLRSTITRLFNKWELKAKDEGVINAIGDQIVKLIQQQAKTQDQKLMILKFLKEAVYAKDGDKTSDTGEGTIDREAIIKLAQESIKQSKVKDKK